MNEIIVLLVKIFKCMHVISNEIKHKLDINTTMYHYGQNL